MPLWFGKIERDVIARRVFTSVSELKRNVMRYIRQYNRAPRTVKWKYADPSRQAIGCDAVSIDGFECGGPPGRGRRPQYDFIAPAADDLSIPFVAPGGMADGRSLVAALALGADGINLGTRFVATEEAPIHANVKAAIIAASELGTRLIMRPLRNTERVLVNAGVARVLEKEKRTLGAKLNFEDIAAEVAGIYSRIMRDGETEIGAWSCGMVAGLIRDIPTVAPFSGPPGCWVRRTPRLPMF